MRKYIVTSVCTLVLSLIGALGANQNASNLGSALNTNSSATNVEQNVTATEDQSLPTDIQTTVSNHTAQYTDAAKAEVTPAQTSKTDASNAGNSNTAGAESASQNTETANVVPVSQSTQQVTTNVSSQPESNVKAETVSYTIPQTANTYYNSSNMLSNIQNMMNSYGAANGQVIVYKNVNLSNCKSANDVINKLQQYGYSISSSNLQQILSMIQNGQAGSYSGSTGTAPTKAPVPTKVPAPTATPIPTKVPAPTATPVPTKVPAPTKVPTPTPAPTNNSGISSYASQVLQLINQERAKAGLSALTTNSAITAAANTRAKETASSFSHTRPNGTSFATALQQFNVPYNSAGENIAYGQRTPQEVVTAWMNSAGHRANILNANFHKVGIGVYQSSNGTIYWSQDFTN